MIFAIKSDKGIVRENNQDACKHFLTKLGHSCFLLADGMGGHNSGDIASKMAVDTIEEKLALIDDTNDNLICETIISSIEYANKKIYDKSIEDESLRNMGTTIVVGLCLRNKLFFAHAGDSRIYLYRNKELERLTMDHSLVQLYINEGVITHEEAENHPKKNVIIKALGGNELVNPDVGVIDLESEDFFIFCTDGLTSMIKDEEIIEIIEQKKTPDMICNTLIEEANQLGGKDNITVIVAKNL